MDLRRRQIALSAVPILFYVLAIATVFLSSDWPPIGFGLALAFWVSGLAVLIYWTVRIARDSALLPKERWVWLGLIWLGGIAGLAFLLYYRVWLDRTLGIGGPGTPSSDAPDTQATAIRSAGEMEGSA